MRTLFARYFARVDYDWYHTSAIMVQLERTRFRFDDEETEEIPFDRYHPLHQPPPPTTEEEEAVDEAAWDQLEKLWKE